jgi:hypothetical protein
MVMGGDAGPSVPPPQSRHGPGLLFPNPAFF